MNRKQRRAAKRKGAQGVGNGAAAHRAAALDQAISFHRNGRLDSAKAAYRDVLSSDPNNGEALNYLGVIALQEGEVNAAIDLLRRSIASDGDRAQPHIDLGNALQAADRLEEGISSYDHAAGLGSKDPDLFVNRGIAELKRGRREAAAGDFQRALALDESHAGAWMHLGIATLELDRAEAALDAFSRAVALAPHVAEPHYNLGNALYELGRLDEAVLEYRTALAVEPHHVPALMNLGNSLHEHGELEQAAETFKRVLRIAPSFIRAYHSLAATKTFRLDDPEIGQMERAVRTPGIYEDRNLAMLHFALGKAYEDIRRYDQAFDQWTRANEIMALRSSYDVARDEDLFTRISQVFDADFFRLRSENGDADELPILIVGMPRSGTTLVEQILASHPDVAGAGELTVLGSLTQSLRQREGAPLPFPESVAAITGAELAELGRRYAAELRRRFPDRPRVTDKMPANFMYLGLIRTILPRARIVHCVRSPIDTCLSCFKTHFTVGQEWSYSLNTLVRYYKAYDDLMSHWRRALPGGYFEIRYENLVSDTEDTTQKLLSYCGLAWNESCLHFTSTKRPVRTASAAQVRQPIYRGSIEAWRRYEDRLGPLIDTLRPSGK